MSRLKKSTLIRVTLVVWGVLTLSLAFVGKGAGDRPTGLTFADWFIPGLIGTTFVLIGCLKLYGLRMGSVGGADKAFAQRLCGT